jgi:hypothetical protein
MINLAYNFISKESASNYSDMAQDKMGKKSLSFIIDWDCLMVFIQDIYVTDISDKSMLYFIYISRICCEWWFEE